MPVGRHGFGAFERPCGPLNLPGEYGAYAPYLMRRAESPRIGSGE